MSRVANNPIVVPEKVEVTLTEDNVSIKGPLGEMSQDLKGQVEIKTNLENVSKQKNDHERRIRGLEKKFWAALGTFFVGIGTFIEGLFMK